MLYPLIVNISEWFVARNSMLNESIIQKRIILPVKYNIWSECIPQCRSSLVASINIRHVCSWFPIIYCSEWELFSIMIVHACVQQYSYYTLPLTHPLGFAKRVSKSYHKISTLNHPHINQTMWPKRETFSMLIQNYALS